MDSAFTHMHIALTIGSDASFVIEENGKPKVMSGTIKGLNNETKMVTLGLDDIGLDRTFPTDSISSYELSVDFLLDALILSRFSSYTDNNGITHHTMHPSPNPQQQPQPVKENETGAAAGTGISPGTHQISTAIIEKDPLWHYVRGEDCVLMQKELLVALFQPVQVKRHEALVMSFIIHTGFEEAK